MHTNVHVNVCAWVTTTHFSVTRGRQPWSEHRTRHFAITSPLHYRFPRYSNLFMQYWSILDFKMPR